VKMRAETERLRRRTRSLPSTERLSTFVKIKTAKGSLRTLASERGVCTRPARKAARMASIGREILGDHYNDEYLTYEEMRGRGLKVVTEKGEAVPTDELQGKIFRIVDKDDASGYVVSSMETTGTATVLCYLQAS
jgi:hypothetical protein